MKSRGLSWVLGSQESYFRRCVGNVPPLKNRKENFIIRDNQILSKRISGINASSCSSKSSNDRIWLLLKN